MHPIAFESETRCAKMLKANSKGLPRLVPDLAESLTLRPLHKQHGPAAIVGMVPKIIQPEIQKHILHQLD